MLPQTNGSLAMIKLSLKLKPMTSIIKHQFHTDIAFACSILRFKNPAVLSFRRGIARGLDQTLFLSLRSDNLTCNPSFCFVFLGFFLFFFLKHKLCKEALSILTLSLGVTTLHITHSVQKLSLLMQFSCLATLPSLVAREALRGG